MISIIPKPVSLEHRTGVFTLNDRTALSGPSNITSHLRSALMPATAFPLLSAAGNQTTNIIRAKLDRSLQSQPSGAYTLTVTPDAIEMTAGDEAGLFYAVQTLRQLLPVEIFSEVPVIGTHWNVPCVQITDAPRFQWRGVMLDCSRHFFDVRFVKKFIEDLSLHKFNIFHWHLTDDQGWRIEIKKYPRLTAIGAWRDETVVGHANDRPQRFDGVRHGGFYTQAQIRDVVAYAANRQVTVVPEIELPGHSRAAIAAYPELGNLTERTTVGTTWGVEKHILNAEESTIRFYEDIFAEVIDLFPSKYIHVGGDEAIKDEWKVTPRIQERISELGLKDEDELQAYIIGRMDAFLAARGRRLIGWDEILEGGVSEGATVMSWRGAAGAAEAARLGHDAVMCRKDQAYLDYYQSEDKASEPLAIHGYLPLEKAYQFQVLPDGLTADETKHVIGGQAQVWSEYMPMPSNVHYMVYPRAIAIAEALWSEERQRDYTDFMERLPYHVQMMRKRGVVGRAIQ